MELDRDTNYWFTSDTHFGHANILKFTKRPYTDIDEMDNDIIETWNSIVQDGDVVFHLGDFAFGSNQKSYLNRLAGNIIFVKGNHDKWMKDVPFMLELVLPERYSDARDGKGRKRLVLCHYSLRSWNKSHYGSWHLFGHHHGNLEPYGLSFDVGIDCFKQPVSLDFIADKMKELTPIVDYRQE